MSPPRQPTRTCLAVLVALACTSPWAAAQDEPPLEGEPWQDNVIAEEDLAPLPDDPEINFDPSGLPRSYRAELTASRTDRGGDGFSEFGLSFGGFRESADLGTFSLDATVLQSDIGPDGESDIGGTATLWQRGLYLEGGWRGNNGLGVVNTPTSPVLQEQFRIFLPSVSMAGLSTQWTRPDDGLQWFAGLGRSGLFSGARVVGFELGEGNVGTVGGQWNLGEDWTSAVSLLSTDGQIVQTPAGVPQLLPESTEAMHSATRWQSGDHRANINLLASRRDGIDAWGLWVDANSRRGRYTHRYGLFNLEPDMAWGAQPVINDSRGAYYRLAYQHARWNWSAGLDRVESISGTSFEGWYATGYARYQSSPSLAYGGSLALRTSPGTDSASTQLFVDKTLRWGQTRLQAEHAASSSGGGDDDSWQLTVDHALPLRKGRRLSLSAAYGELSYNDQPAEAVLTFAAYGGLDLSERLTLDGSARWTDGDAFRGADLNLNLGWRISSHWWLVGTIYENQGSRRSPFVIDPLATEQPFINLPRDRSVFLSLRYERQAGTSAGVLGGSPGMAAGTVSGSVFLDENGDGERSASELPAANVTVLLDGRYAVRTDSQGEFEFPRVAIGAHTIEVVPDNLPLPWFLAEDGESRAIEVRVRDTTRVDVGARRQR